MKKIFILLILVSYIPVSELSAKKKAVEFCDSILMGAPAGNLRERAVASGARADSTEWMENSGSVRFFHATFTGFYPGSDFICEIAEKYGVVIRKNPNLITSLLVAPVSR